MRNPKIFALLLSVSWLSPTKAQNKEPASPSIMDSAAVEMKKDASHPKSSHIRFDVGGWTGIHPKDKVCYFWYSEKQEMRDRRLQDELKDKNKMYESYYINWEVNGRTFTDYNKSGKKPAWKDAKLILRWIRGKTPLEVIWELKDKEIKLQQTKYPFAGIFSI